MKEIVALIHHPENNEVVVQTAVRMAQLFDLDMTLMYIIEAPYDWEQLGRSARDSHPGVKTRINKARLTMDHWLTVIRSHQITAKKAFLYYDQEQSSAPYPNHSESLVISDKHLFDSADPAFTQVINQLTPIKLIVDTVFEPNEIEDIVLSSDFHTVQPQSVNLINALIAQFSFHLNLVFINSNELRENSEISITNMKKAIAQYEFRKTSISIFNAEDRLLGAEQFANIKGGDLIITEERNVVDVSALHKEHLPIIIIQK